MGPTGFSEAMVRDLVADLLVAVPAGRPWTARLSVSLHPFGTDPERFFRDMSVHTCLPGRNEPSFSTLNRQPWSDDQAEMVEDVAEHSLLSLTRLELECLSGLDDAVDGAQRLARAAASGEPPWTSVSMFVRGRPDQVDALRLATPLSAVYVVALKDRMVGVVHWDAPTGTSLEGLSVVGRDVTIPGPLLDRHHVADK